MDRRYLKLTPFPSHPAGVGSRSASVVPDFDHNGNLISYKGWSYIYDAQNRLTSASNGAHTALFHYDGKNRQIMRSIDGAVRFSVWDDWELIEEYDTSNVKQAAYLQGAHGVVKSLMNNIYYYQDKLGSTTHIADGGGNLLESYRYDLYGTPSYFDSTSQPLNSSTYNIADLYAGERWVSELGLYDLRNRFMSPELGRFLQTDPVGFKGDASNLYRYCHNDPEDFSDPMGLYETPLSGWEAFSGGNPPSYQIAEYHNPLSQLAGSISFGWIDVAEGPKNDNAKLNGAIKKFTGSLRRDGAGISPQEIASTAFADGREAGVKTAEDFHSDGKGRYNVEHASSEYAKGKHWIRRVQCQVSIRDILRMHFCRVVQMAHIV